MTGNKDIIVTPLAVALRGEQGSIALFEAMMPKNLQGKVGVWATCGQRKRFPVPAEIRSDVVAENCRRVLVAVKMPAQYSACTLHVHIRNGFGFKFGSCRIPDEQFRELAPTARNAENDYRYHEWFLEHRADEAELERQRAAVNDFAIKPLFSIVTPIFRTPEQFLVEYLDCLLGQTYGNLELVLVNVSGDCPEVDAVLARYNDERVRVIEAPNRTIPENTNVGIEAARGDYVAFVDHDDFVEPDILFRYVEAINEHPECDLLFCDEDLWDGKKHFGAKFKPGWNPDFLCSQNYICHMMMVSRWALERIELSGPDVNGAQDFDLALKVSEIARKVRHVPGVLYHWRAHSGSTAERSDSKTYAEEAGRRALIAHYNRLGLEVAIEEGPIPFSYRPSILPNKEQRTLVVLLDDDGVSPFKNSPRIENIPNGVKCLHCSWGSFNELIAKEDCDQVVVLGEATCLLDGGLLEDLTGPLDYPGVGCCSAMLSDWYAVVASSGLVVDEDGSWHHAFAGYCSDSTDYILMLSCARDVMAVPMRCLTFRKEAFMRAGGFCEDLLPDEAAIDFCLELASIGLRTMVVPRFPTVVTVPIPDLENSKQCEELARRHPELCSNEYPRNPLLDSSNGRHALRFD